MKDLMTGLAFLYGYALFYLYGYERVTIHFYAWMTPRSLLAGVIYIGVAAMFIAA